MNNNKPLVLFDNNETTEKAIIKGTDIILKETKTGKTIFRGGNKVLVSGSEFNALKDFNFDNSWESVTNPLDTIPSYDTALAESSANTKSHALDIPQNMAPLNTGILDAFRGLDVKTDSHLHDIYKYFTRRVFLFCVGIDGCGIEASRVYKVQNTKWIAPYEYASYDPGTGIIDSSITNCLIPFKVKSSTSDLSAEERNLYFGRSTVTEGTKTTVSYYFKGFDQPPTILRRYADDSAELANAENVWKDPRKAEGEVVVQLKMSILPTDCREYFNSNTGANTSRINTISLCTAVPYLGTDPVGSKDTTTQRLYYRDIRPLTKFNFPNESLIDSSKGVDITYYLYY